MAIVGSKYLKKCRELWEYQAMTISENHKCGMGEGGSWELLYMIDSMFYQQIVSLEATILKDQIVLYFTTFLAYGKFILGASNVHRAGLCLAPKQNTANSTVQRPEGGQPRRGGKVT